MSKLTDICPDFPAWPESWMGIKKDLEYGEQLLEAIRPFAESLAEGGLAKRTIKKHLTNLWLLGGEVVRNVSLYDEYSIPASEKLEQSIGLDGGPYCRHLNSEAEMESFDATCRKLHKFLQLRTGRKIGAGTT
jgi:hypothetical protein